MSAIHQVLPSGPYAARAVPALVPQIDAARFRAGEEGYVVVVEPGTQRLPPARCQEIRPDKPPYVDLVEIEPGAVPIQRPLGMPDQGPGLLREVAHPALTIARLRNVVCVPGGIVLRGDKVVADSFNAPWDAAAHAHMQRDKAGDWHLRDRGLATRAVGNAVSGPVLYLDHQNEASYGAFIADIMSRAWSVEYARAFLGVTGMRSLCAWPAPEFAPVLIEAAGIPLELVTFFDRPVFCEELIVATKSLQLQEYVAPPATRLFERMRERLVAAAPSAASPVVERLFVSRRGTATRMLIEEPGVEQVFADHGFTIVQPEQRDVRDQARLFANARLIAGCSGSNMYNLAFAREARAVMLFASPLLVHYAEQMLLAASGAGGTAGASSGDIGFDMVLGFVERSELILKPGFVHAKWHLDLLLLQEIVRDWVKRYG